MTRMYFPRSPLPRGRKEMGMKSSPICWYRSLPTGTDTPGYFMTQPESSDMDTGGVEFYPRVPRR